ncbi:MAG TPA: glycosyltransferase [Bacteroidia bacterium]|jgi:cellulose synthase/poly-beta-1,6-N-acetylglucosamine synthase-like glycosyltransferase|nr:glycosyltransferase [Bacteroidia bacterium]
MLHTYIIYPAILYVLAKNKKNTTDNLFKPSDALPDIAVICAAYNEERVIEEKINSVFTTNYPKEKISFYIGTDACSDNTVPIVKRMQAKYPLLKLVEFTERSGKINILNKLCSLAQSSVFVMTDANVFFKEDTFFELAKHFKNQDVKLVCGNIIKRALNQETVTKNELHYLNFENFLKSAESKLWSIVIGAEGGCYALRKTSYLEIPAHFIADDFFITCHVLNTNGKIVFEDNAVVHEDASAETKGEFRRKARIATGNFQNLAYFKGLLKNPFSKIGFAFLSHKVLRWLTPFFFMLNAICCAFLGADNFLFEYVLAIELAILFSPVLNALFEKMGIKIKPLISASHFVVMNRALFVGFVRYSRGVTSSVWQPVRQ